MKTKEISDIFESNLTQIVRSTIKPVRFRDDKNKELWDVAHQEQMGQARDIGYTIQTFHQTLYDLYDRLCAVHGEKVYACEDALVLSRRVEIEFTESMKELSDWKGEETGFRKRCRLSFSESARKERDQRTEEQVRQILKMPQCYSAFLALISASDEFKDLVQTYEVELISWQEYENITNPPPFPFAQPLSYEQKQRKGKILPVPDAHVVVETLGGSGFTRELLRRSEADVKLESYGIQTMFTSI